MEGHWKSLRGRGVRAINFQWVVGGLKQY